MKDVFFLRFNIQRSTAAFSENQFDVKEIVNMSNEEIDEFLNRCDEEQQNSAEKLKSLFCNDIEKLYGKKILFIGDSITQDIRGYRGVITKAAELNASSIAFSGATSADMLRKTYDGIINSAPDIVSLMIGTNDVYFIDKDKSLNLVSLSEYVRNIRGILRSAKEYGARLVVGLIPPMDEEKAAEYKSDVTKFNTNRNIEMYNKLLIKEIEAVGGYCIDTYSPIVGKTEYFEPDGVHISPDGHMLLSKKWIEAILKII